MAKEDEDLCVRLEAAIAEGRGLLKDLRDERKRWKDEVELDAKERFEAEVAKQVLTLGEATKKAMDAAVEKVSREFDKLEAVFLGKDKASERQGMSPLEDLIPRYKQSMRRDEHGPR